MTQPAMTSVMSPTPSACLVPSRHVGASSRRAWRTGLAEVDALLRREVDHDDPFIAEANTHLIEAGGKRFRPLLTLLASELGTGVNPAVVASAAGVELTHVASLCHDDVMDEAEVRRGAASANAKYGNSTAILVGDMLFGTASSIIADLGARGRQDPGRDLRPAVRRPDPRRPARARAARTRSTTTSGCWPTRPAC